MTKQMKIHTLLALARYSLAFLWIFTGLTSVYFDYQTGHELLINFGFNDSITLTLIYSGAILDIGLGLWILNNTKMKLCYVVQIIVITSYTILLTMIEPSYWLHPFGPLSKNLPIIMLIFILHYMTDDSSTERAL
ncbi:DoxX-like family protein [Kangiella koreensis]|uniref:NAD-dependent epimerase/dehydratase n=1 Tax=Kangiella koreensis (strain DSM 16069 / JCM 12317 / KCTC 12182 / SW-125) TaxID=523791 RepID=C7R8T5_KANKD|nr:DoxX-like family protein [Kangiella koreensis]ACV25948.1 NAD-dependent epimerase/dehydratase [Kangiella koreensis DSM 16069]